MVKLNQNYGLLYRCCILIFFLGFWLCVSGQANTGQFINYGMSDGLCEAVCSGVAQDSRGFYWISTQGGINRFDGANFKSYYPSEMLGEKQLLDNSRIFFEYAPNLLLLNLGNSEAFVLNTVSQKLIPVKSLKGKVTADITRIDKNTLAVSSIDTVFILNKQLEIIQKIAPPLKKKGNGILLKMLSPSQCVINSIFEYFLFDFKTGRFQKFSPELPTENLFNTGYELIHVDRVREHLYFVNFFQGLIQTDYSGKMIRTWNLAALSSNLCGLPNKIIPDENNKQWVWVSGTMGIAHWNLATHQATVYSHNAQIPFSIVDNQTNNIFLDRFQNLWVTTYNGLSMLNRNTALIDNWDLKLSSDIPLMNMCRISGNEILAVKYNHGVYQINEKSKKTIPYHKEQLSGSWFVFRDGYQLVHGGKGTILKTVDLRSGQTRELSFLKDYFMGSELVTMGLRHSSGDWWFSANSGGGLVRYNPKTKQVSHFSKAKSSFTGSYFIYSSEAPNGDLWFSSNKTQILTHWIKKEDRFEEVDFAAIFEKQHQSIIFCLTTDKKGNVWVGFDGGGLVCYHVATKKITFFGKKQGIPSNYVYNLVFDNKERLWIGTKKGLACLNSDLKTVRVYGVETGFPSGRFDQSSYFDKRTNRLWIACDNYLLKFFPDKLLNTKHLEIGIFIDEFLVSNQKQALKNGKSYYFPPDQNTVQLTFTPLNSPGKEKIEYSYLLEGASGNWVSIGTNSSVNFPSLPYGTYIFHLRGKIPGTKTWVYLKSPLRFEIATPWYRTWWFKTLLFLAISGLIFFVTRMYFLRKIEKQRGVLEKQRAVQNERDRIAYDMHDDLGSGLTKISYLSKEAIRKTENRAEIDRINETSLELVKNMSELIWAMKVENDSLADLMSYLRHYAMEYFDVNKIDVQMELDEFPEDQQISGEIRRQVFLIFQEALHNIVQHAETKRVFIRIEVKGQLRILIRDYGKGLKNNPENQRSGNGMKTMQERTGRLHGKMELKNSDDGVELIFEIPLDN